MKHSEMVKGGYIKQAKMNAASNVKKLLSPARYVTSKTGSVGASLGKAARKTVFQTDKKYVTGVGARTKKKYQIRNPYYTGN